MTHPGILETAREQVLERGEGLGEQQVIEVLRLPDDAVDDALALAHEVRMRWCGPEVEVEGIVSLKTGGCPEDCHFCSQSGRFETPVRAVRLDIPSLVEAARADRRHRGDRVLHRRRGARARRAADGAGARRASRRSARRSRSTSPARWASSRASRRTSWPTSACTATTTTSRPRAPTSRRWSPPTPGRSAWRRCSSSASTGWRSAAACIIGMGETLEQRAELAAQLARAGAGRGAAELPRPAARHALRRPAGARFARRAADDRRLPPGAAANGPALRGRPRADARGSRHAPRRLGGINAIIVGNYLTTLGRDPQDDLEMLEELSMPVKALSDTL